MNNGFIGILKPKKDVQLTYKHQDGYDVSIKLKKDDKLLLIEKSNEDWWKCMRELDKEIFYVPSTYVIEILNEQEHKVNDDDDDDNNSYVNDDKLDYENLEAIMSDLEDHLNRELKNYSDENDDDDDNDNDNDSNNINTNLIPPKVKERKTLSNKSTKQSTPEPDYDDDDDKDDIEYVNTNSQLDKEIQMQRHSLNLNSVNIHDDIVVPEGWLFYTDKSNKKYFFNETTKAKWYLHRDSEGKPYFYNSEGESIWNLPEQNNNDTEEKHFSKNFDEELSTFKNLYSRNSIYVKKSNSQTQIPQVSYSYKPPITDSDKFKIVKLVENKIQCKKSKAERYRVELASSKLLFIKENSKQGELAWYLDFKGGKCYKLDSVEHKKITQKLNSSKNAFLVETLNGCLVAFLNENVNTIDKWVSSINSIIKQMQSEFSPIYEGPESLHCIQNIDDLKSFNPTSTSKNDKNDEKNSWHCYVNVAYQDELSKIRDDDSYSQIEIGLNDKQEKTKLKSLKSNELNTADKFKAVKLILITFLKRRPQLESLKQRGIYQECVFGCNLISLCAKERRTVPLFVEEIIKSIEMKGVDNDGLYRISGNLAEVQKLRCLVDQGKYNFNDSDIHVLTGTLKSFFREIEDPVIPKNMQEQFINALGVQDKQRKFQFIKEILKKLPLAHRETLKILFKHLIKVISFSSSNRMHLQNIALVFGPTICRLNPLEASNNQISNNIMVQNELVEYILFNFNELFDENQRSNSTSNRI